MNNVTKVRNWLPRHARYTFTSHPPAESWLDLVERLFAEITGRCVRRGSHTSIRSLEKAMLAYLERNETPPTLSWGPMTDMIPGKVARLCNRIYRSDHQ
jgi:hypothetical protein